MDQDWNFFKSLFDISFSNLLTTKIIKVLYILAIVFSGLMALGFIVSGFSASSGAGLFMLILAPVIFLLHVISARVFLEIVIVIFKIAENTQKMVQR